MEIPLKPNDVFQCRECGYRISYKKRTRRSWHNNHHAFEHSARHGREWWQIDVTWYVIRFLEAIGLARDVKLPTETQKKRRALIIKYKISEEKIDAKVINNGKLE